MQVSNDIQKPVILFDIDNTLIDTKRFATQVFEKVRELFEIDPAVFATQKETFYKTLEESTDFSPEAFVDFIGEANRSETALTDPHTMLKAVGFFYDKTALANAIFADVIPNLERLSIGNTLGIFSQGHEKYQLKKIENSGLIRFFEQYFLFIGMRKTSPEFLHALPRNATIIDDREIFLNEAIKIDGIRGVLIQRNTSYIELDPANKLRIISSLDELNT